MTFYEAFYLLADTTHDHGGFSFHNGIITIGDFKWDITHDNDKAQGLINGTIAAAKHLGAKQGRDEILEKVKDIYTQNKR